MFCNFLSLILLFAEEFNFFIAAGGKSFDYIPALNEHPSHLELLCNIILQHTIGWPEFSSTWNNEKIKQDLSKSKELAEKSVHNKN